MKPTYLLLYKVVRVACLKLKISTVSIGSFILGNFHLGTVMVLSYFIFRFKSWDGFKLLFRPLSAPLNKEPLDNRGVPASEKIKKTKC